MTTATPTDPVPGKRPAPNTRLIEMISDLAPGQALELGCGNGGDALWLAQRGWKVTALDISATSVDRLTQHSQEAGLDDRITAKRTDLNQGLPSGRFNLVNAHYLHAVSGLDRAGLFRNAAHALQPGGYLLIVDHGSTAPWSWNRDPDVHYPSPQEVSADIDLDPSTWQILVADAQQRMATGPNGRAAEVTDHILMIQRTER
ncbi:SAM-dependent methyltransferase [Rhodococcus sp. NPDC060090]|uniref:SAM-dependent methyltransferase n=1 Tax=Rhodococcus sp. NPDC060090 TaxID=3347056 RepID=UPI0036527D25